MHDKTFRAVVDLEDEERLFGWAKPRIMSVIFNELIDVVDQESGIIGSGGFQIILILIV